MTIRHLLFDADGVIQVIPGGWRAAVAPYLGDRAEEFLRRVWHDELPAMRGDGDFLTGLAAALVEYGVPDPAGDVFEAVWHNIERVEESFALIEALRRMGYGIHLGSNQERRRASFMKTALGYDRLFDTSSYSCDLGVAKPEPDFFIQAARRIPAPAASILFIDDLPANVDGARSAGLNAETWDVGQGHPRLVELLERHGVSAPTG